MLPEQLVEEVKALRKEGYSIDAIEADGWAYVIFHEYVVPSGYTRRATELLLKIPMSYPNGRPDMFWTSEDLKLKDGRIPQNADLIESVQGTSWRRFSWHPQNWNPGVDNLRTYLEFVNNRLAKGV